MNHEKKLIMKKNQSIMGDGPDDITFEVNIERRCFEKRKPGDIAVCATNFFNVVIKSN